MNTGTTIAVIDFRRHSMVLQWHSLGGTWTACDIPPPLVHGIALIRASQPNICLYGQSGHLKLQVGPEQFALSDDSPRISCNRGIASFGFRRRFKVESSDGNILFSYTYWTGRGRDFFRWLADKADDAEWRANSGRQWSSGIAAGALRSD